jgi:hypothetical protein
MSNRNRELNRIGTVKEIEIPSFSMLGLIIEGK